MSLRSISHVLVRGGINESSFFNTAFKGVGFARESQSRQPDARTVSGLSSYQKNRRGGGLRLPSVGYGLAGDAKRSQKDKTRFGFCRRAFALHLRSRGYLVFQRGASAY